jgi:hypothetical protein
MMDFVYCGCGCGKTRPKRGTDGRLRLYIHGHGSRVRILSEEHRKKIGDKHRGKTMSEESRKKIGESKKGNKNNWKGDNVSYDGLHRWIRRNFPKYEFCQLCNIESPKEVACITGIYNREFKNWARFCSKCHKKYDNISTRGWITRKNNKIACKL